MHKITIVALVLTLFPCVTSAQTDCDGKVRELPADVVGHPFRTQCYKKVAVAAWTEPLPFRFGKQVDSALYVVALNMSDEPIKVSLTEFAIVSLDEKHPDDAKRAKVIFPISPVKVSEDIFMLYGSTVAPTIPPPPDLQVSLYNAKGTYVGHAVVDNPLTPLVAAIQDEQRRSEVQRATEKAGSIVDWVAHTGFVGGVISPHGSLAGILFFPKVKGVNPMLLYTSIEWKDANLKLPLGDWIDSAR